MMLDLIDSCNEYTALAKLVGSESKPVNMKLLLPFKLQLQLVFTHLQLLVINTSCIAIVPL